MSEQRPTPEKQPTPDSGEPWQLTTDFAFDTTIQGELAASFDKIEHANRAIACVNACRGMADPAKEIERLCQERDEARAIVSACMSAMPIGNIQTHTPENLAARIGDLASALAAETSENEAMREAIREAYDAFLVVKQVQQPGDIWSVNPSVMRKLQSMSKAALAKIQPFIKP